MLFGMLISSMVLIEIKRKQKIMKTLVDNATDSRTNEKRERARDNAN